MFTFVEAEVMLEWWAEIDTNATTIQSSLSQLRWTTKTIEPV